MSDTGIMFLQEGALIMGVLGLVAWVLFLLFRRYQVRQQESARKLELFGKLVDKFGDSDQFVTFVKSDEGRQLLKQSGMNGSTAKTAALRMFIIGALLFAVGYGSLSGASAYSSSTDINYVQKVAELKYWGRMAFGLGVGFVAGGLLTRFLGDDEKEDGKS